MKAFRILFAICCVTAVFFPLSLSLRASDATPTTKPSLEEENQALRSALASQEKELNKLRQELHDKDLQLNRLRLKQKLATLQPPAPSPFSLTPMVPPNMPKGSVPKQFNGSTYYLVPLAENTALTPPVEFRTVTVQDPMPDSALQSTPTLLDDRTGPTRELIHGK